LKNIIVGNITSGNSFCCLYLAHLFSLINALRIVGKFTIILLDAGSVAGS
jgi:hypothetical protein